MTDSLVLYGAALSPFTMRVLMQIEAKGLDIPLEAPPGGFGSAAFKALTPLGKVPVLRAGDAILFESEVICEYLEDRFPDTPLRPADLVERAAVRRISRLFDIYVMNPMLPLFRNLDPATRDAAIVGQALEQVGKGLDWIDALLGEDGHAVGRALTLADCAAVPIMPFVALFMPMFGEPEAIARRPRLAAYWSRIREDPHAAAILARQEAALSAWMASKG